MSHPLTPKSPVQNRHFNNLFVSKENRSLEISSNRHFWNELLALNSAYPNCTIYMDYYVCYAPHFHGTGYYGIDVKLKAHNKELHKYLQIIKEKHYLTGYYHAPKEYYDYFEELKLKHPLQPKDK